MPLLFHEEQVRQILLADFRFMQHGDLHSLLLDIALREGVEIRYNTQVAGLDSISGAVILANGERMMSNLVVGADGQRGLTRKCLLPKEVQEDELLSDQITLLFTIPTNRMRDDEDLKHLIKTTELSVSRSSVGGIQLPDHLPRF
ncbi:hypothetical protein MPER_11213 [Moniliophthora perniciosa FA553]|nr:hypothetical protein MPER_11213 [Moniliophthora perniciosa FA553]